MNPKRLWTSLQELLAWLLLPWILFLYLMNSYGARVSGPLDRPNCYLLPSQSFGLSASQFIGSQFVRRAIPPLKLAYHNRAPKATVFISFLFNYLNELLPPILFNCFPREQLIPSLLYYRKGPKYPNCSPCEHLVDFLLYGLY